MRIAAAALAAVAYLVVVPALLADKPYLLGVLTTASALSLISMGVWLTFMIGRINIGQGAFALVGGYTTAILTTKAGLSFWLALPLSGLAAAAAAALIGWSILRLRGVYFAMITLSLTETMRLLALNAKALTGGATGIVSIPTPGAASLFGLVVVPDFASVNQHLAFYYLSAALLLLGVAIVWRIANSRMGWLFRSLQQNEELAASIGVNVAKFRVIAFAVCSFLGGLGGAFFTASQQSIYPSSFGVPDSIYFMLYCFLGGLAYVFGPVVGTFILFISFELLHGLREYQMLIYSLVIIALMLWLPNGLLSLRPPARLAGRPEPAAAKRRRGAGQEA
ncbi:MAG: branched-chain amino acid ABC transporter permease [Kiloniellaceae bacterium]